MESGENLEFVRSAFEAWNNGDLEAFERAFDPDVMVAAPKGWPEGEVTRGRAAWMQQAQRLRDTWREARLEIDEIRQIDDQVLVQIRYVTVGEGTGIGFETPMAVVFSLTGGSITEARYFWEKSDAVEAVGQSS